MEIFALFLVFSYQFTAKCLSLPPPLLGGAISKPLTLPFALAFRTSNIEIVVKGDNAKRHYRRHNEHHYAKLIDQPHKACVENLKRNVKKQTSFMSNFVKSGNCRVEASYRVAYHLGDAGKPFSDGELVKKIILDVFILNKKATNQLFLSRVTQISAVNRKLREICPPHFRKK